MSTYTIYGSHGGGYLYGNRHSGDDGFPSGNYSGTSADVFVGISEPGGTAYEGFLTFDTSAVVGTVTTVTLSLWGSNDHTPYEFDLEVRAHDWGATLEADDWLSAASLDARTLVASRSTTGWSTSGYNPFVTEDVPSGGWGAGSIRMDSASGVASVINQGGETRFVVCSSFHREGIGTESSFVAFVGATEGSAPKLEVVTV